MKPTQWLIYFFVAKKFQELHGGAKKEQPKKEKKEKAKQEPKPKVS